jgi:tetratricopeptide (TPR) repeat protein
MSLPPLLPPNLDRVRALEQAAATLKRAGRHADAIEVARQLTELVPDHFGHLYNLGNAYLAAGQPADAVAPLRQSVALKPDFAYGHNNLGQALRALGRHAEAVGHFEQAARLDAANPAPWHMAGFCWLRLEAPGRALPWLREANRLAPANAAIMTDLGDALRQTGALREVEPLAREAARLAPERIEVWNNLANALRDVGKFNEAEAASRQALTIDPRQGEAHYNLALTLLAAGKLEQGWPHWEARWAGAAGVPPRFAAPPWDGRALAEGVLFLHSEQGLGDTLQFCRYAMMAAERARVVLAVQTPLLRLLRTLPAELELRDIEDPAPEFVAHAPLQSLPMAFGTSLETLPAPIPYLFADPAAVAAWRERLAGLDGRKVGLVWAGSPVYPSDAVRSIPAPMMQALGGVPGVRLVSLQVGDVARPAMDMLDFTAELGDFADTAALVAALDLVIGVDTAVIHLAGALGKPVWLLNRFSGDWRWGQGERSPWYPGTRIFRQRDPGDWGVVLAEVREELGKDSSFF